MRYENGKVLDLKIAYVGGGSRGWAWGFMTDLTGDGQMEGTVRLYDIDRDAAEKNAIIGRKLAERDFRTAIECSMAAEYIDALEDGVEHQSAIKGANLSGGQRQRLLVARALAARPEILVLDDSSSALDYRTDAAMRRAIQDHYGDSTLILIAQRVSSIMGMTHILVMDNGACIGYGTHEELMKTCPAYRETYQVQMGEIE